MSIKGFKIKGVVERYDYESLDNKPDFPTLKEQVDTLETDVDAINKSIESINKNASSTEEKVTGVEGDIAEINESIGAVQNDLSKANNNITAIGGDISWLGYRIDTLNNDLSATNGDVETLSGEVDTLKTDMTTAKGDIVKLGEDTEALQETLDNRVNMFHASIDNSNFRYVKGSADFTYEQVVNTENCQIEVQVANEKVYLKKQEFKNINPPDPIAGRYVGFSEVIRVASEYAELFLFVYDPENLPTDEENMNRLENWGDYQYCVSSYQPVVMGNFLNTDVEANKTVNNNAPSTKAVGDYTDKQCGVVLDYMQTTFADNIMAMCEDKYGAHIIYKNADGFEASNSNVGDDWQLTGLDLTPYKRLKFYVKSSGSGNDNFTPSHIVEMHLGGNAIGYGNVYVAGHASQNPNNGNRIHYVTFAVNAEKTAVQFVRATSLYGTASTNSSGGRTCYLIEGYKV